MAQASPFHANPYIDQLYDNIDHNVLVAYHKFANCLSSQFDSIRLLNANKKDLLRRLLVFPKKFLDRLDASTSSREQYGSQVEKTCINILQELISLCTNHDEQDEADELVLDLHSLQAHKPLSSEIQCMISQALERRSLAVHQAFTELEVLGNKKIVSKTDVNVFPANNAAVELGLDWSALRAVTSKSSSNTRRLEDTLVQHDAIGRGPLHVAVECCKIDLVRRYANNQVHLEERDSLRLTPLLLAALTANLPIFQLLLEAGASLAARDLYRRNALIIACESANLDVVRFLLQRKSYDPNEEYELQECTLLYAAASKGHYSIVQVLLSAGADCRKKVRGKLPREAALEYGHTKVAQLLQQSEDRASIDHPAPDSRQRSQDLPVLILNPSPLPEGDDDDGFSFLMNDGSIHPMEHPW